MDFIEFSKKVLRETSRPMSSMEIWQYGLDKNYISDLNYNRKEPWHSVRSAIYNDIRSAKASFEIVGRRPIRYYLKGQVNSEMINSLESQDVENERSKFPERDLHKYLSYYLFHYHNIYSKTIFHEISSKKRYAEWLHPDLVGVQFIGEQWESEVAQISKNIGNSNIRIFSYEVKILLNFQNLRESYFQAVSNSSWADEGYLVVSDYERDEEFLEEFQRLSNSFGIGLIHLNVKDPDSSDVIFPAKSKHDIDFETMNKIASINKNFKDFLKRINLDQADRKVQILEYDSIPSIDSLETERGLNYK